MIRSLMNFLAFNAFVALLPIFWLCAEIWGSNDERWLLHWCVILLSPFCAAIWLIILTKGRWISLAVIPLGYGLIVLLLRMRVIAP